MKIKVCGRLWIEFLDLDANERGIKTIKHSIIGEVEAENKALAKFEATREAHNFINREYPCRWNSGIYFLEVTETI